MTNRDHINDIIERIARGNPDPLEADLLIEDMRKRVLLRNLQRSSNGTVERLFADIFKKIYDGRKKEALRNMRQLQSILKGTPLYNRAIRELWANS